MPECGVARRGFTLVELLVVVAIIGLLMGVLLPTLRRARSQAREVKCATQLREYAHGFGYYFAEYHDVFPAADYGIEDDEVTPPTWFHLVEKYWLGGLVMDHEEHPEREDPFPLGRCPELTDTRTNNAIDWEWEYSWRSFGYGYNRFWLGWNKFDQPLFLPEQALWRPLVTVKQPSECLLVADSNVRELGMDPAVPHVGHYLGWAAMTTRGAGVDTRHGASASVPTVPSSHGGHTSFYLDGRGNIAWVDGHVTARTSLEINQKVRWRHLWDPTQTPQP